MAKSKTKREEDLGWKLLSPDEVRGQRKFAWNTPDGKAPAKKQCQVQHCLETTVRQPPICDHHFYGLLGSVRGALIRDKAKSNGSNGHVVRG